MPRAFGSPDKLTPETQDLICQAIRAGNYAKTAAGYANIDESTFYYWLKMAEKDVPDGIYSRFLRAVKKAEHDAEVRAIAQILKASEDQWQAAAWYLERKFPGRWARTDKHEVSGPGGGPIALKAMTDEQLQRIIESDGLEKKLLLDLSDPITNGGNGES